MNDENLISIIENRQKLTEEEEEEEEEDLKQEQ